MKRTEALLLKEEIDRGVRPPRHNDVEMVCIYLVQRRGYEATFKWVEDTYGKDFLPETTKKNLINIIQNELSCPKEYFATI